MTPEEVLHQAKLRIGQTGLYSVQRRRPANAERGNTPKLWFPVKILKAEVAVNRPLVLVTPVDGEGQWWVALDTVRFSDNGKS